MLKKFFLVVFAAFFIPSAFAQTPPQYEYQACDDGGWCTAWGQPGAVNTEYWNHVNDTQAKTCISYQRTSLTTFVASDVSIGTQTSGSAIRTVTNYELNCSAVVNTTQSTVWKGFVRRAYVPPECPAGNQMQKTFFSGWYDAYDPETLIPGTEVTPPTSYCDGSCSYNYTDVVSCDVVNAADSNGNYPGSCTIEYESDGMSCTVQTPDPAQPDSPPPGSGDPGNGDGNGDGDGDPTTPADPNGNGDPGDGDHTCGGAGQPACSTDPGNGGSGNTACTPEQIANGTCSTTTPPTGGGGGSPTPEDPATCGGEGQPLCNVKVDETGMPTGSSQMETMDIQGDAAEAMVKSEGSFWTGVKEYLNKSSQELAGWNWSFALPTGCTPVQMSGYDIQIDVCEFQPTIHDLMSFVWVLLTIYGLIRLFIWGID